MKIDFDVRNKTRADEGDYSGREGEAEPSPLLQNVHSTEQLRRLSRLHCWKSVNYLQKLTREYWRTEMRRDFLSEAVVFAVIVVISAWPMILLVERMAKTFP